MPEAGRTVAALVDGAAALLREAGIAEPRREAWQIWGDLMGETPGAAYVGREQPPESGRAEAFGRAVRRRAAGEPLAYVTGLAGFRRLVLRCDRRALIPRPETEGLVDLVLAQATHGRIADLGTGSGCLALALADEGHYDLVVGVDRSSHALALAAENRARTGLGVALIAADFADAFAAGSLDAAVSNPPYLTQAEYDRLDPSVRAWEPESALASGTDGLDASRRVIREASRVVRGGGWLALEVDASRAGLVAGLAREAGWVEVTVHNDLFDRARYLLARRSEA